MAWVFLGFACQSSSIEETEIAFYHWKSRLSLDSLERSYWQRLSAQRLYLRFFDVDWNPNSQSAEAIAEVELPTDFWQPAYLVPTVFITNRTLIHLPDKAIAGLAQKITGKIREKAKQFSGSKISEIQLDCDWSARTREKFFQLLRAVKTNLPSTTELSVTIRLHQFKYPSQTGVPPADRGVLMFYNMGNLQNPEEVNSILNLEIAQSYLHQVAGYPLHLDVALPIFSWGVLKRRGRVINLIHGIDEIDIKKSAKFRNLEAGLYQVSRSHYYQGIYLYQKDQIRIESPTQSQLAGAVEMLKKVLKNKHLRVLFYHLDDQALLHFSPQTLREIADRFTE